MCYVVPLHPEFVSRLFGSMFTNGIGRTTDMVYADVLLYILLLYTRSILDEEG